MFTTAATAAIPVFIGLSGDDFVAGKVIPSILAALTATVVALGQIERPHERWSLYRRYQRILEADAKRYKYRIEPFDDPDRGRILAARVAQHELDLQAEWEGLIPTSSDVASVTKEKLSR
jgi:arginyl-tRNA--protein-N-Asp/Glu arginylyltransferase